MFSAQEGDLALAYCLRENTTPLLCRMLSGRAGPKVFAITHEDMLPRPHSEL
jgi:hypothetical protein